MQHKFTAMNLQDIPKLKHATSDNFFLLAGPCAIESETMALQIAEKVCSITDTLEIPYIFKGSFKKANRSRIDSFTGIGDEKALKILRKVSETFDIPTVTDIHEVSDAAYGSAVCRCITNTRILSKTDRPCGCGSSNRKSC